MYRALARFAQRWQAKLQLGRFVAGAGKRGATPTRRVFRRRARPGRRPGRRAPRAAGRRGRCAPRSGCRTPWPGAGRHGASRRGHGPRARRRLTSDSGPPISTSAGTSRSPMCELTTSVSDVSSNCSARRLTAQIESWPSTSRNGSCGLGAASGGAETSSPSPQREHTREAGWMSDGAADGRNARRTEHRGGGDLRGPEGRRDVGVRSRGFHLTAVSGCAMSLLPERRPPRPAIENV